MARAAFLCPRKFDFHLVRSKRDVYHPRVIGKVADAISEARELVRHDHAGVSIVYHPHGGPSIESVEIMRLPWSRARSKALPERWTRPGRRSLPAHCYAGKPRG